MEPAFYEIINRTEEKNWWYRVRRKIVRDVISQNYIKNNSPSKVLDIGCGVGTVIKAINHLAQCYGIDNSRHAIEFCFQRSICNVTCGDIRNIPFVDDLFDIVLALDVLEHLEDDLPAIKEIKRVLTRGGIAIIFVPAFEFLWGKSDELSHHFRRYTLEELTKKIQSCELRIIRSTYFNTTLFIPIFLIRLFVNLFKLPIRSENEMTPGFINQTLYFLFLIESFLLKYLDFPIGVSGMIICKK